MSEQPTAYRTDSVYVSYTSRAGISYIAKAMKITPDQLADNILADWLKANHHDVVEHMKTRHEADDAFRLTLQKRIKPVPFEEQA